ncbi:MFS transporter [Pseudonocardiaceae bacterium YIM PH 21723]|nr:MFS transporter [Pseudonocardiaceae bacterium YIM PH 21723]
MLGPYRESLRTRFVARLFAANIIGRMPEGMAVLAIALYLRDQRFSYPQVGTLAAVYGLASVLSGPVIGRLMDRRGQPLVLVCSVIGALAGYLLILSCGPGDVWRAGVGAALAGGLRPLLEPGLRALWHSVLSGERALTAVYSLDAIFQEIIFVAGPLLVIAVIAAGGSAAALVVIMGLMLLGTVVYVRTPPVRAWRTELREPDWAGALRSAPFRRLLSALVSLGVVLGVLTIAAVAYQDARNLPGFAGYLLGANALGALIGGLVYGSRTWPVKPRRRFALLVAALAVSYWPLAAMPAPGPMLVAAVLSGLFLAPALACLFTMVGDLVPAGTITEAHAWIISAFVAGQSAGSALAGLTVARLPLDLTFVLLAVFGALGAAILLTSRHFRR